MKNNSQTITNLSKHELWYILSLGSSGTVIGFRNPVIGMLTEDMFPLVQEASFSLLDRDLIYADSNNSIKIKDGLDRLIIALTEPHDTILVAFRLNNDQRERVRSFNFKGKYIVLLEELVDGSYLFREIESKDDLLSLVAEPFSDKVYWSPDTDPFYLPQDKITLIQQLADVSKINEVKIHLESAKGDEQSKAHFLETLQNPTVRYSLISFMDRNNPQKNNVDGFSIISGEHYVWILEIVDEAEKIVRISKITLKDLNKKFSSMIPLSLGE